MKVHFITAISLYIYAHKKCHTMPVIHFDKYAARKPLYVTRVCGTCHINKCVNEQSGGHGG